jgi:serine/threonine-protein kinase
MGANKDEKQGTGWTQFGPARARPVEGRPTPPSGTEATYPAKAGPAAPAPPPESRPPASAAAPAISEARRSGQPWLDEGTLLGKYRIVGRLGSGGMGAVYEAVHVDIGKPVALKTLSPTLAAEEKSRARFLREAAAASRLDHPAVVNVTDYGSEGETTFIVMELLRGEDLAGAITRRPTGLDVETVADVMLAVCAGVEAAHQANIVHRDLKPQNIFLSRSSVGDVVPKVLDFGIAKIYGDAPVPTLTNTGAVLGTTHYLSPEQLAGGDVDARSDQFALGVILYEALTGRRPHEGETVYMVMRSIGEGRFRPPRELRPGLPPALEAVILRAMSRDPADRFESVHALGRALLPLASTKRKVLWADFYERSASVGAGQPADPTRPSQAPARPVLAATRTRPAADSSPAGWASSSPAISVPDTGYQALERPRKRGPGLVLGLAVFVAAGLAVFFALSRPADAPGTAGERKVEPRSAGAARSPAAPAPAPLEEPPRPAVQAEAPASPVVAPAPPAPAPEPKDEPAPAEPIAAKRGKSGRGKGRRQEEPPSPPVASPPLPAPKPIVAPTAPTAPPPADPNTGKLRPIEGL